MNEPLRLALIYGSTREGRFCDRVAAWAVARIEEKAAFSLDVIDPATLALPTRHERAESADLASLRRRIEHAQAFVIVTPEYNHSFPAALKLLIDSVGRPWQAKPIAFVSYGGISGGLRAVEQLRLVFAELHAMTIRDGVSFANVWGRFDEDGSLSSPDAAEAAMAVMLEQLHWWGAALRLARETTPYPRLAA